MNSIINKWQPKIENFPKSISIIGLYDDLEGFRIIFKDDKSIRHFKFTFENYVSYRNSDEGVRLKSLNLFPNNSRQWCLFKTSSSDFIDWIITESTGIYSSGDIIHYFFTTSDDIIEVLALEEPLIEEFNFLS
jgi:hypothetical protein